MTEESAPYGSPRIAAVIGCGAVGTRHTHNVNRLGYAVRTWDLDPARCTVPTLHEALDGATLAVIATPPASHIALANEAIKLGVPWVLIEKPLALSLRDAETLLRDDGVFVGYCLRFALATQLLPDAIKRIVPVRMVEAVYSERVDTRGSWLADCGVALEYSHVLDLLLSVFGIPDTVQALSHAADTALVAALEWGGEIHGTLRMDFLSPTETRIKIIGDGGVVEWRRDRISGPGCDETVVENPAAWLLHEAQELHSVIKGAIPSPGRLCTVKEAMDVLRLAERLR